MTRVKICGLKSVEQAVACVRLGADAIGVNLVPSSVRCTDLATARAIVRAVADAPAPFASDPGAAPRALVVAVVADLDVAAMRDLRDATGVGCLQLHGSEPAADVAAVLPHAYKAVRVADGSDVALAESMPGDYVMVDAKVPGFLGGSGHRIDASLVVDLAARRRLILAGGLDPGNVAAAIARVKPWCVDVASGVESAVGVKDLVKVKAFVDAVRGTTS